MIVCVGVPVTGGFVTGAIVGGLVVGREDDDGRWLLIVGDPVGGVDLKASALLGTDEVAGARVV